MYFKEEKGKEGEAARLNAGGEEEKGTWRQSEKREGGRSDPTSEKEEDIRRSIKLKHHHIRNNSIPFPNIKKKREA